MSLGIGTWTEHRIISHKTESHSVLCQESCVVGSVGSCLCSCPWEDNQGVVVIVDPLTVASCPVGQDCTVAFLSSSLRQFCSITDFVSYLVGFLIHLSPYYQNCFCFPICRYRNHVSKILTVRDLPIVENWKIFPNVVFDQIKHFGTLNATQKSAALYIAPFLKKSGKTA